MTTDQFDAGEVLRANLATWWASQSLSTLGTPSMGGDDGSAASSGTTAHPRASVRFGDVAVSGITNSSKYHSCPVTWQVYHNTPAEASAAGKPLWKLLAKMQDKTISLPTLTEGYVSGVRVLRFNHTQLAKTLWRVECETDFEIVLDRSASA